MDKMNPKAPEGTSEEQKDTEATEETTEESAE